MFFSHFYSLQHLLCTCFLLAQLETQIKVAYLTLLTVSVGAVDPGVGLRFRGLPGPRRAGLLEISSFL